MPGASTGASGTGLPGDTVASRVSEADPLLRKVVLGIFVMLVAILTLALYLLAAGVVWHPAPRTAVERRIDMLALETEQQPRVAKGWGDYAHALIVAKQYDRAAKVIKDGSLAVGSDAPEVLLQVGYLAQARGRDAEALAAFKKTQESVAAFRKAELKRLARRNVSPDPHVIKGDIMTEAATQRARMLAERKQWDDAIADYGVALAENPVDADVLVERARAYLASDQPEKAVADLEFAVRLVPDHRIALNLLEQARSEVGR